MGSDLKTLPNLPDKLSDCLEVALADLERVEKMPDYQICMGTFHHAQNGKCVVCLAGAAMAGLGVPTNATCDPWLMSSHNCKRLDAVSDIAIDCASWIPELNSLQHVEYYDNPEGFKAYIRQAIAALREAGK